MRWASVTFMAMAWSGCAGQRDTLSVEHVGDTIVVTNVTPTVRDTADFVLVTRVGRFGGGPEYEFSEITALAVDDEGGVYTFDRGAGIRSFDRSGEFRGWVARIGEGLSEVGCTQHLAVDHGTVAAYDRCNRRITLFPVEGEPHSLPIPSGLPRFGWDGLFFDEAGALWIGLTPPPPAEAPQRYRPGNSVRYWLPRGTPTPIPPERPWEKSPSGIPIFFSMSKAVYSRSAMTLSRVMFGAYSSQSFRNLSLYVARMSSHSSSLRQDALGKKNQPFMACLPAGACVGSQSEFTHVPAPGRSGI